MLKIDSGPTFGQFLQFFQEYRDFMLSKTVFKDLNQGTTFKKAASCLVPVNQGAWDKSLHYAEEKIFKRWSGRQNDFVVLSCLEDDHFNEINILFVMSACVFAKGDTEFLELIFSTAVQYLEHPSAGFLMNNLGVMFGESGLYDKSEKCFTTAKRCFEHKQDHLRDAVATLNLAAQRKVCGDYRKASSFADFAAVLCHDISMRTVKDHHLPERLLRRLADLLEELGNSKKFHDILEIAVNFDFSGANKSSSADLIKWVMEIQLKYLNDENIEDKGLENLTSSLFVWMDEADEIWNAELIRTILIAAEINQRIGYPKKADMLVDKLEGTFLMHHSCKDPSYGSLLYQIGHFKVNCARFNEAEVTLKQAEKCLIQYFGKSHHAVALCKSLLGTCALLKNNTRDASHYLSDALIVLKKISHYHPEAAKILLKCALLGDQGDSQSARNTTEEALEIFLSSCGKFSSETIGGYIQSAVILQKEKTQLCLAVDMVEKGIALCYSHLGLAHCFPDVMLSHSLLGVFLLSLGNSEEAENCFVEVQRKSSTCRDSCCVKTPITINPEVMNLFFPVKSDGRSRCICLRAQVVSLVNLVGMKVGDERQMYLKALIGILEEHKTEMLEIQDFAGQSFLCARQRVPALERPVFCILSWTPKPSPSHSNQVSNFGALESNGNSDSDRIVLSCMKMSPCVIMMFLRGASNIQELKESRKLDSTLCQSVGTLFLQPNFRKAYEEGKDFFLELPTEHVKDSCLYNLINCLPILVELKLAESHQESVEFDCLMSWSSPATAESSVHISHFSYRFSNKRAAEFAFDYLISNLGKELLLGKVQVVEISVAPASRNVAFFPFEGLSSSFLSVVVDGKLPVISVKCHSHKTSESLCACSLVQNALVPVMESLSVVVQVTFEASEKLSCEGVSLETCSKSPSSTSTMDVGPGSCSILATETGQSLSRANTRYSAVKQDKKQSEDILQNQDAKVGQAHLDSHGEVDLCLYLLDNLLSGRIVLPEEEPVTSNAASSSLISSYNSSIQLNHSHLFPLCDSACSLNSLHTTPPTFSECGPFEPSKLAPHRLPPADKLKENDLWSLPIQRELSSTEQVSENSLTPSAGGTDFCVKLCEKPSQFSDQLAWSNPEEVLTTDESNGDYPKQYDGIHQAQGNLRKEGDLGNLDHNCVTEIVPTVDNLKSKVDCGRDFHLTKCIGAHLKPNQQSSSQSYPEFLSSPVSEDNGEENLQSEAVLNFEDEFVSVQNQCHELREQVNRLEELLKHSEAEKLEIQAELGRYLFLEDKQRRSGKVKILARTSSSDEGRLCAASASVATSDNKKLLGGAGTSQEPSFTLQSRLLEISNSVTEDELKQMKFLSKGKVSGFRLARIREGFELFEELETDGKYPWTFIGQLLEGIKRFDLLEKLVLPLSGLVRSDHPTEAGMVEKTNGSPKNSGNSPEPLSIRDDSCDREAKRLDKKTNTANQASCVSSKESYNNHSLCGDNAVSKPEKNGLDYSLNGSVSSGGGSDETSSDMSALSASASSESSSSQSDLNAREQFPDSSSDSSKSDSSSNTTVSSSDSFVQPGQSTQTSSNGSSQDSSDSASRLSSVTSHSAAATGEISSDSGRTTTSSEEEITCMSQLLGNEDDASESGDAEGAGACAASIEDRKKGSVDSCDGTVKPNISGTSMLDSEVNSTVDNSAGNHSRPLSGSGARNRPLLQQSSPDVHGQTALSASSSSTTNWERQGARPKQVRMQRQPPESVPHEIIGPLSDGLAGDFLARHSQDRALHQSLYRDGADLSLFNDALLQGASYANGMLNTSESNAARAYFGDCQVASRTYPYSRLGSLSRVPASGLLGGCSYNDHLSSNSGLATGPLPSHLAGSTFTFHRNYPLASSSNVANGHSFQSSFVNSASGFAGREYFSRQSYLQYDQHSDMGIYQLGPRNQLCSGMAQWNVAEGSAVGAVGFQMAGHSLYSTQRHNVFGETTASITPEQDIRQTSRQANVALPDQSSSFAKSNHVPSASTGNTVDRDIRNSGLPAPAPCSLPSCSGATSGTVSTTTSLPSPVCTNSNTLTLGNDDIRCLIASRVAADGDEENSLVPHSGSANADNVSTLNRDFGANSGEGTDNSLVALEQRVAEACALVERVLREREEREQFGREIERKEQMIREQRERERREREEREIQEAERWPQQQEAITARSQWLCEHYQRHCRVRFPCCGQFYPCHRCHNNSRACDNEEAKACHATHLQCNHCQHEQEIDENSGICSKCGGKMSAYFCSICKHFTSVDKNPYHCEKCGICRIHKDKSFHCDTCNVCLDKRLDGNHKCRPDSGHDECCICLEDAFSGCQILPCSHKVHRECAIAMIQNGIRTCPICRHPLYSPSRR